MPTNGNVYIFDTSVYRQCRLPLDFLCPTWAVSVRLRELQRTPGMKGPVLVPYRSAGPPPALWGWFNCEDGWRRGSGPGVSGSTLFSHPGSQARGDGGQRVKLNLIPGFPSLLSCIFIGAPGAYHFGKFTKRLTAKINNKKCPLLKPLTLWNKAFAWALPEFFQYEASIILKWHTTATQLQKTLSIQVLMQQRKIETQHMLLMTLPESTGICLFKNYPLVLLNVLAVGNWKSESISCLSKIELAALDNTCRLHPHKLMHGSVFICFMFSVSDGYVHLCDRAPALGLLKAIY